MSVPDSSLPPETGNFLVDNSVKTASISSIEILQFLKLIAFTALTSLAFFLSLGRSILSTNIVVAVAISVDFLRFALKAESKITRVLTYGSKNSYLESNWDIKLFERLPVKAAIPNPLVV